MKNVRDEVHEFFKIFLIMLFNNFAYSIPILRQTVDLLSERLALPVRRFRFETGGLASIALVIELKAFPMQLFRILFKPLHL